MRQAGALARHLASFKCLSCAESSVHLGENDPNKVATTWRNPQAAEILVSVTSDYRQRSGCLGGILPRHAGMQLVGGSGPDHPLGASAFLSSRPDQESHEIALFANRAYAHIAFKVFSLAELRSFHARVLEKQIPIRFASATVCPLR